MPEPVTLVLLGGAALAWWRGRHGAPAATTPTPNQIARRPAAATAGGLPLGTLGAGTGPNAPLATNTSVVNAAHAPLADALAATPIPSGLIVALDNDTALKLRAYAALNPADFQAFLDKYAAHIQLRDDLYFHALTDPPAGGYQVTPGMAVGLGVSAYKVAQAMNGVAAGNYGDLLGVSASVAGQIPGVDPLLVKGLQGVVLGYRVITSLDSIINLAAANNVAVSTLFTSPSSLVGAAGAYPGLAAVPLAGVLMAVGLCVDIGFTIAGNEPDVQKAIDVALDVASIAVLFIPIIGVVIALVIQLVKFIIDLFGGDLFGGGLSHTQREALETARYGQNINPMFPQLADAYTPRELFHAIVAWGSGYCGGQHVVAMAVSFFIPGGDVVQVGGQPFKVPAPGLTFEPGNNPSPGACYWLANQGLGAITNDEQAILIALYGANTMAEAQAGIAEALKGQFNTPTRNLIEARTAPMRSFLAHGLSLDQIDQVAMEYRAQPHLNLVASLYGYSDWQHLLSDVLAEEWTRFNFNNGHGSLADFAKQNGYASMYAFRAAALASYEQPYTDWQNAIDAIAGALAQVQAGQLAISMASQPTGGSAP